MKSSDELIKIAIIGKAVGLKGELKFHLKSDFPEQFQKDKKFHISKDKSLTIEYYHKNRDIIKFKEINSREEAQKYVNKTLFSTIEDTKINCKLEKDEFFWFDIIGCQIEENNQILGRVVEIEEFGMNDYLVIKTDPQINSKVKTFYIPYIDKYISKVDISNKIIKTKDAKTILDNS